jgi:hypothetical protein
MPETLDYSSPSQYARPRSNWAGFICFLAVFSAVCAVLKSVQYHRQGQLDTERVGTAFLVGVSVLSALATVVRLPRYARTDRPRFARFLIACLIALAIDALAVYTLCTAVRSGRTAF